MNLLRQLFLTALTLTILASNSFAVFSQARAAGSAEIVICSPDGTHNILIGANGEPVEAEHDCFECCLVFDIGQQPSILASLIRAVESNEPYLASKEIWIGSAPSNTYARGPPAVV